MPGKRRRTMLDENLKFVLKLLTLVTVGVAVNISAGISEDPSTLHFTEKKKLFNCLGK